MGFSKIQPETSFNIDHVLKNYLAWSLKICGCQKSTAKFYLSTISRIRCNQITYIVGTE